MKHFDDYTERVEDLSRKLQETVESEIGKTYNQLTITSFACRNRHELYFNCKCVCGTEKVVKLRYLENGHQKSCGCMRGKIEIGEIERDDLTGQMFGLWTVLRRDPSRRDRPFYICRCECGTERSVDKYTLKNGTSWHCGCQAEKVREEAARKYSERFAAGEYDRMPSSLVGQRFGRLVVEELLTEKRSGVDSIYRCRCDCGNVIETSYASLKNEKGVRSCGCLREETRNDLKGQRFGRLVALEPVAEAGKRLRWRCRCDCGRETLVQVGELMNGNTRSCGCLSSETSQRAVRAAIAKAGNVDGTNLYAVKAGLDGKVKKNNTSGVRGVYVMSGRYYATITFKGNKYALGGYGTLEEAAAVRHKAEQILFGEWLDYYEDELKEEYEKRSDEDKQKALEELVRFQKEEAARHEENEKEPITGSPHKRPHRN